MASPSRSGSVASRTSSAPLAARLQLLDDLLFAGDDLVRLLEAFFDVDPELLRQVLDVALRGHHLVLGAEVLLDRLGLRRRFDDDERLSHQWTSLSIAQRFFSDLASHRRRKKPGGPSTTTFSKASVKSAAAAAGPKPGTGGDFVEVKDGSRWLRRPRFARQGRAASAIRRRTSGELRVGVRSAERGEEASTKRQRAGALRSSSCATRAKASSQGGAGTTQSGLPSLERHGGGVQRARGKPAWTTTTASASATRTRLRARNAGAMPVVGGEGPDHGAGPAGDASKRSACSSGKTCVVPGAGDGPRRARRRRGRPRAPPRRRPRPRRTRPRRRGRARCDGEAARERERLVRQAARADDGDDVVGFERRRPAV